MEQDNKSIVGRPNADYISSCFDNIIKEYEKHLYDSGKTKKDVRCRVHTVARFLKTVEQRKCTRLKDLTAIDIYETFQNSTSKLAFRWAVGAFLRYAFKYKLTSQNLHLIMPRVTERKTVPTVYSPNEIEQMLCSIDRTTNVGKRNYAIVLIAARLGLRASDIARMTFSCLNLKASTIRIIQKKTKTKLELPLLNEVKNALFEYINGARPDSDDDNIFLNLSGLTAITPGNIGYIVHSTLISSGIDCGKRKTGSHVLRSSLATALLAEGKDYAVIQKILGHRKIQSVKVYAKVDVEQLRVNSLSVPMPIGNFANLLGGKL